MRTRTSKSRVFAHARPCFRGGTPQGIDGLRRLSLGARFRRQALAPTARPLGHWGLTAQRRPSEEASMTIECRQMPLSSELPRLWQRKCKEERVCRELLPLDSPHISPRLCRGIVTRAHRSRNDLCTTKWQRPASTDQAVHHRVGDSAQYGKSVRPRDARRAEANHMLVGVCRDQA